MGFILLDAEHKLGALLLPSPSPSNMYLCLRQQLRASVEVFYCFRYLIDVEESNTTIL